MNQSWVFNYKFQLYAVCHDNYNQAQYRHYGFFGRIDIRIEYNSWLLNVNTENKSQSFKNGFKSFQKFNKQQAWVLELKEFRNLEKVHLLRHLCYSRCLNTDILELSWVGSIGNERLHIKWIISIWIAAVSFFLTSRYIRSHIYYYLFTFRLIFLFRFILFNNKTRLFHLFVQKQKKILLNLPKN